jgi:probable phosphoglycerate mutase
MLVVVGVASVALFVAAGFDVVRGRRAPAPPAPAAATRPRRLVLVRHGETEWSATGRHTGRTDVPLTERGRAQAAALREALEGWQFDAVLVSPLGRARETAELLGRPEPVEVVDDLREWDYGADEGRTTAEIRVERPGWTVWSPGPAGGETIDEVAARTARVLRRAAAHEGDVLLVAHAHVLLVLATRWLQLPPGDGRALHLDPATVSVLERQREQPIIRAWNVSGWRGGPPPAAG